MRSKQVHAAMVMWAYGSNTKEIADEIGVNRDSLWNYIRRHRDQFPHRNHHEDWWREHLEGCDGMSGLKAAEMIGSTRTTVCKWRKRLGDSK